jgi:GH15 family glucan-1,4-alpha-glucosidase
VGELRLSSPPRNAGRLFCWPRFDSGACFSALLGNAETGRWQIRPAGSDAQITRRYQPDTLILETTFATAEGEVVLIDFVPLRGRASHVVRLVVGKRGVVAMRMELIIRFDYGASVPWVRRTDEGDLLAISGPDMLVLRTPVELRGERLTTVGDFTVAAGQTVPFVLMYVPSHLRAPDPADPEEALRQTQAFWQEMDEKPPEHRSYADAGPNSRTMLAELQVGVPAVRLPSSGRDLAVAASMWFNRSKD